jgi:SpoVK/Ycf46/Vps4 family AAA+-type ATPase
MAARAIASELCLPLYRVDLSSIVSKWVGETEKNLRHALEAAESAGAVLLFDEGDALMSKRGEVTRGTDRYANLEVSYLLQAIEAHDGIVVVTTNLRVNLDSAFVRRFDVSVEFAPPTSQARLLLWMQELGPGAHELDEDFMQGVSGAELTGGNIAAAARLALALARKRGSQRVGEQDISTAIGAEFLKLASAVQAAQWAKKAKGNAR